MSRNIANILWTKACHDFNAGSRIADANPEDIGDQVLGLLLQQSVEKATKALITAKNLKYSHTHDIHHLFQLLAKKIEVPQQFEDLIGLSMFATREKYESPILPDRLDKQDLLNEVKAFLEWVAAAGNFN